MPPKFSYWTIVMENAPTAFRAREPEELLPTLRQLQRRHPDATMKWVERGRVWESPEAARAATSKRPPTRDRHDPSRRPFSPKGGPRRTGPKRPRRRD